MKKMILFLSLFTICTINLFGQMTTQLPSKEENLDIEYLINAYHAIDEDIFRIREITNKYPDFHLKKIDSLTNEYLYRCQYRAVNNCIFILKLIEDERVSFILSDLFLRLDNENKYEKRLKHSILNVMRKRGFKNDFLYQYCINEIRRLNKESRKYSLYLYYLNVYHEDSYPCKCY